MVKEKRNMEKLRNALFKAIIFIGLTMMPCYADVIFVGDFETGDWQSQWDYVLTKKGYEADRVQIVTSPVRQGNYSARVKVMDGDNPTYSGEVYPYTERTTIGSAKVIESDGDEYWYGMSFMLDTSWEPQKTWLGIAGWHFGGQFSKWADEGGSVKLRLTTSTWWSVDFRCGETTINSNGNYKAAYRKNEKIVEASVGEWHDFIWQIRWRTDNQGLVRVWHRTGDNAYTLVLERTDIPTLQWSEGAYNCYPLNRQGGLYRNAAETATQIMYRDGFVMGETAEDIDVASDGLYSIEPTCPAFAPGPDACTVDCPCGEGEGDCDSDAECEAGLTCVQDVGADYGWPASRDVCEAVCPAFAPGPDACTVDCPCGDGEGDCDSDADCEAGLTCVQDVGADYGWPASRDVCEAVCPAFAPGPDACTVDCPCGDGEGDCDSDADCEAGLTCVQDVGADYGWPASRDVCEAVCPAFAPGPDACTVDCPCGEGEGDCDSDAECEAGLTCVQGVGADYGWPAGRDVCESACPAFVPGPDACTVDCPCGEGEGDCDSDAECEAGLTCVQGVGANYGWPAGRDVCE